MAFVTIPLTLHRFENCPCPHQYFAEIYLFFEKVMLDIKTFFNARKAEIFCLEVIKRILIIANVYQEAILNLVG